MTQVLFWSDLHADKQTLGVSRYDECARAAEQVVRNAIVRNVGAVVFCGDLSDPDEVGATLRASALSIDVARELSEHKVESLWCVGNHDCSADGTGATTLSPLKALDIGGRGLIHVAEEPCGLIIRDLHFICLPFTSVDRAYDPDAAVRRVWDPATNLPRIVVSHLMIPGIIPGEETIDMPRGRDVLYPFEATRTADFRISGHYHRRQVFDPKDGGPPIHVVGSACRFSHGESENQPSFLLVTF